MLRCQQARDDENTLRTTRHRKLARLIERSNRHREEFQCLDAPSSPRGWGKWLSTLEHLFCANEIILAAYEKVLSFQSF